MKAKSGHVTHQLNQTILHKPSKWRKTTACKSISEDAKRGDKYNSPFSYRQQTSIVVLIVVLDAGVMNLV